MRETLHVSGRRFVGPERLVDARDDRFVRPADCVEQFLTSRTARRENQFFAKVSIHKGVKLRANSLRVSIRVGNGRADKNIAGGVARIRQRAGGNRSGGDRGLETRGW